MTAHRARRRLGQHFLHDPAVIARIVAAVAPARDDTVVEIGGGRGALTLPLLDRLARLHVVEVDSALAQALSAVAGPRCVIHLADALDFDFAKLAGGARSMRVVGNLPYNISTPLLFRLLEQRQAIRDMHLMLQKEVVDRMLAKPGGRDYGRLTVMLAAWADLERCFDIGPGAFSPPPRVWSTFVRVVPLSEPRFPIADPSAFARVVAHAFSMRRKTLARTFRDRLPRERIAAAGLDPSARPEVLAPRDFSTLAALCAGVDGHRAAETP
jgi:16S rRNA (adenine1518-N6/adenine1519-N6)-dimethyltransferase